MPMVIHMLPNPKSTSFGPADWLPGGAATDGRRP
jgi:hypothetical protein